MELKKSSLKPGIFRYWILEDIAERGVAKPFNSKDEELLDRFEELARDAVSLRLASDVPLGVFLSGGLDSSTVTALIQATGTRRAHTFTIGFDAWGYDEAKYARAVAEHLGTEHTECYVGPEQALAVIPELPNIYDEPFADAS